MLADEEGRAVLPIKASEQGQYRLSYEVTDAAGKTIEGGYLFTTIGRPAYVQVGVPTEYAPEANALVDLAVAVKEIPAERPCV